MAAMGNDDVTMAAAEDPADADDKPMVDADAVEKADALKTEGNAALQAGHLSEAINAYTQALALNETAVLYANRSFA